MRTLPSLALLGGLLVSCGSSDDTLPNIVDCQGVGCSKGKNPSGGGGGSSGSSGQGGSSGQAGTTSTGGQSAGVTITGSVKQITNPNFDFDSATTFTLGANVSAKPSGTTPAVATALNSGAFTIDNVALGSSWIRAQASNDGQQTLAGFRTITIGTSNNGAFDAYVVDQSVLTTILGTLPTSTSLNPSAAHAVIHFINGQGQPVTGVTATSSVNDASNPSSPALVVGDNGPDYGATSSGPRGILLVLNFASNSGATLTYQSPNAAKPSTAGIQNSSATVSFVTIVVP